MEDSDDSNHEDVWSPTLREDVFSNHDMMGNSWSGEPRHRVEYLPLPNFTSIRSQPLNHINWPNSQSHQQQRSHNSTAPTKSSSSSSRPPLSTTSVNRSRSHLDLPNFPLQAVCTFGSKLFLSCTFHGLPRHYPGIIDSQHPFKLTHCSSCCLEEEEEEED